MKKIERFTRLLLRIYIPIIVFLALFAVIFMQFALYATSLSYVFAIFSLILLLGPWGKKVLGPATNKQTTFNIVKIGLLQLSVLIIFLALVFSLTKIIPVPGEPGINSQQALNHLLNNMVWRWGLLPFSITGMLAVAMAHFKYNRNINPSLVNLINSSNAVRKRPIMGMGTMLFGRQGIIFCAGISLGLISLAVYQWVYAILGFQVIKGGQVSTLILFSVIFFLTMIDSYEYYVGYFWRNNIGLAKHSLLQMCLLTLALIIASPVANFFGAQLADPNFDKVFAMLRNKEWLVPLQLLIWTWWLSITPLLAMLLAPLLKGMKISVAILWMLFIPGLFLFFFLVLKLIPNQGIIDVITYYLHQDYIAITITVIGFLLLISYFYFSDQYNKYLLMLTYQDKLLAKKERLPKKITRGSLQLIIILTLLYLLCGLDYIAIFYFAIFAIGMVIFAIIGITLIMDLMGGFKNQS